MQIVSWNTLFLTILFTPFMTILHLFDSQKLSSFVYVSTKRCLVERSLYFFPSFCRCVTKNKCFHARSFYSRFLKLICRETEKSPEICAVVLRCVRIKMFLKIKQAKRFVYNYILNQLSVCLIFPLNYFENFKTTTQASRRQSK